MSGFKQLYSDTLIFAIGSFATKLLMLALMPLYTFALTKEEFGLSDLLNNSLELLMPILTLCISDAVFRFSIDKDTDLVSVFSNGLFFLLLTSSVFLFILLFINYFFDFSYWIYFFFLYITGAFKQLFAQFTRGIGYTKLFAVSGIVGAIALLGSNLITLLWFKMGVAGFLLSYIISNIISVVFLFFFVHLNSFVFFRSFKLRPLKEMLTYSFPLIPNMLSWWFTNVSSRYIVMLYCGMGVACSFSAASRLPAMVNILSSVFQQAWQLSSVREYNKDSSEAFYTKVFEYYSAFILIISSLVILFMPLLAKFFLVGDFYDGWVYVPLLMLSGVLGCYSVFFGTFYLVIKKNKMIMLSTLVGAVINVLVCTIGIPLIGVYGALIANVLSYLIIVVIRFIDTRRIVRLNINFYRLLGGFVLILLQAVLFTLNLKVTIGIGCLLSITIIIINASLLFSLFKFLLILVRKK